MGAIACCMPHPATNRAMQKNAQMWYNGYNRLLHAVSGDEEGKEGRERSVDEQLLLLSSHAVGAQSVGLVLSKAGNHL
jgi:hypothetical protein